MKKGGAKSQGGRERDWVGFHNPDLGGKKKNQKGAEGWEEKRKRNHQNRGSRNKPPIYTTCKCWQDTKEQLQRGRSKSTRK